MTVETQLHGKDAAVEALIATLQQKLNVAGFNIVEQSWQNPLANIWSVTIVDDDCSLLVSHGKGLSKNAALASALGEFIERLSTHHFWENYYLGAHLAHSHHVHYAKEQWFKVADDNSWPDAVLSQKKAVELNFGLRDFYNPNGQLNPNNLIDTNSANRERGICCIPYECVGSGEKVNFPVNIIGNLYSSNGMAAGNTLAEAHLHALTEIIQRYIQFKVIAEGISLPKVPNDILNRYPNLQDNVKAIQATGFPLLLQDASLGGEYPVLVATLLNPHDQGVQCSFGAHPIFEIALERAITGLFQGRNLQQLEGFAQASFDMDQVSSPQNLENHFHGSTGIIAWKLLNNNANFEFVDWDKQASKMNVETEFKQLCNTIHASGNEIFISDYNEIGVYACHIIVPGLSEIYPLDDLLWENNNTGIDLRQQILKPHKTNVECEQLIEAIEALDLDDDYLVAALIAMPSDPDSIFNDLCIVEYLTLLALKVQDNERIQEGCEWLLDFQQINPRRLKTYQCIDTLLQVDGMKNYASVLEKLYSLAILNDALALIDGEDVFPLVSEWNNHSQLIEAYNKVIKA